MIAHSYCTLFDKNYLDKGIVMIDSLKAVDSNCKIYILCMDDFTYMVLNKKYGDKVFALHLNEIMDDDLHSVFSTRTKAEFCWTCTAKLIRFILSNKREECCTYVDADLYFYSDPSVLIEEMLNNKCSVQVIPHWFGKSLIDKARTKESGKFCVQFNTFLNNNDSISLLDTWVDSCIKDCSLSNHGDQKYLNSWDSVGCVNITKHSGAGIAPWNLKRYCFKGNRLFDRYTKKSIQFIFYHFQNIVYLDRHTIYLKPCIQHRYIDKKLYYKIYIKYLLKIEYAKKELEREYNFLPCAGFVSKELTNTKKMSVLKRINIEMKKPFIIIVDDFFQKIRKKTRKKYCYIDLTRYFDDGKNNSLQ